MKWSITIVIISLCLFMQGNCPVLHAQEEDLGESSEFLEEEAEESFLLDPTDDTPNKSSQKEGVQNQWMVLYLKASYRQYYRLQFSLTDDQYGVPFNIEQREKTRQVELSNTYASDNKIHLTERTFSYLRFDYSFVQDYNGESSTYKNYPDVNLYEAYLNHKSGRHWLRIGGMRLTIGKVDFNSPIDILNLSIPDKVNHLDRENSKVIMPIVQYNYQKERSAWALYWGPFQRVSEDNQSVRANLGVHYKVESSAIEYGLSFFHWFDPDNEINLELVPARDGSGDELSVIQKDTPILFATMDLDTTFGNYGFKADIGYFWSKNYYHITKTRVKDSTIDVLDFKTVKVRQFAIATSLERKFDRFFLMPTYNYRRIFDVPANTHIFQFENKSESKQETRDLEKHQLGLIFLWDWDDNSSFHCLMFASGPYQQVGISGEVTWMPSDGRSRWRFFLSHVESPKNKMTGLKTSLNRFQTSYTLKF